jgi:hypothetical protein
MVRNGYGTKMIFTIVRNDCNSIYTPLSVFTSIPSQLKWKHIVTLQKGNNQPINSWSVACLTYEIYVFCGVTSQESDSCGYILVLNSRFYQLSSNKLYVKTDLHIFPINIPVFWLIPSTRWLNVVSRIHRVRLHNVVLVLVETHDLIFIIWSSFNLSS